MGGLNSARLRVGVIGLGRLWEARHKPALAMLKDRFQVTAVYDHVARRAEIEASQAGARPVDGLLALIERTDVDVVYLLAPQWFGLFPIELACQFGKAVYCAIPLTEDLAGLQRIDKLVRASGVVFMPEFARRFYPTTLRLRELLATSLGPPRLVIGQGRLFGFDRYSQPGPSTQIAPATLLVDPGSYLIDWCRFIIGSDPVAVQGFSGKILPAPGATDSDFETFLLEFADGAVAQLSAGRYHRTAWGDASRFLPEPGLQVFAERGVAWMDSPDRIQWTDSSGSHEERLPLGPSVGQLLNDHFHRMVRGVESLAPEWDDAIASARLIALVRQSSHEGRRIETSSANSVPWI